ncbi:hypothetical protein PS627_03895 [Pseudomonas fluorescens]|uniref:substrate-binding periplasmic protein n=1 Tax=Pseudomonas fluorescens TaxID=294 RepID=UPI00125472F1|nr:transporter substrate-binding domain-containing protein [Pseudomonas fluorescens]CAG8870179.1 hypothetical protein PS627_03895 [Pseudomonas fluorescens]VVP80131.1 hypothetical protein PS910_01875 [Pseudomonas fluorescens]
MRRSLVILLLWATHGLASEPVLRFSVAESWSMPLIRIENEQPVEGILYDLMQAIARHTGARPEYHVMAKLRLQQAMEDGDIDVRCYVATQWLNDRPGDYLWSVPVITQLDLLVAAPGTTGPSPPEQLPAQAIGTVLGFAYPPLEPFFTSGHLEREDSRSQLLVLHKLHAGRYQHAVSNQLSLDWFNRQLPDPQRLRSVQVLDEQQLGCMVRSDSAVPAQGVLRALVRMKQSGEVDRIIQRYTCDRPRAG